ncbi:hypothetical protein EQK42_30430, partial [Streptomyces albidoflavus]
MGTGVRRTTGRPRGQPRGRLRAPGTRPGSPARARRPRRARRPGDRQADPMPCEDLHATLADHAAHRAHPVA